jgi:hypothetical protein
VSVIANFIAANDLFIYLVLIIMMKLLNLADIQEYNYCYYNFEGCSYSLAILTYVIDFIFSFDILAVVGDSVSEVYVFICDNVTDYQKS